MIFDFVRINVLKTITCKRVVFTEMKRTGRVVLLVNLTNKINIYIILNMDQEKIKLTKEKEIIAKQIEFWTRTLTQLNKAVRRKNKLIKRLRNNQINCKCERFFKLE